jgi:ABC-type sugar transport system ATPase subunit
MTTTASIASLLRIRGISKTFPGVRALIDVSLDVAAGEVVAVVGQNGSGKSTLVKILAGVYHPDPGGRVEPRSGDERTVNSGPEKAAAELHFIHQDLGLIPSLTTIENLDLGRRLGRRLYRRSPVRQEKRRAEELLARFGVRFDVTVPIVRLTTAERTLVAIARALDGWSRPDNVLVLDEPTAALHGDEVTKLFQAIRGVAGQGAGVIFISHRLDEVMLLADRIVVLRDGRVVADAVREVFDHDQLVRAVAGRAVAAVAARSGIPAGDVVFSARGVSGPGISEVDLDVHAGEVVGVTGLLGSGCEKLAGLLFGAERRTGGTVSVCGHSLPAGSPRAAVARGVGYVPADRQAKGAIMSLSARENLTLPRLDPLRRGLGYIDRRAERIEAGQWFDRVDLRPRNGERRLGLFSGGNQQKVVLAKWLRRESCVLLLDEPTQGVDVGAKSSIYELVAQAARGGAAVLISSSETKELAAICDRVLVLRNGRIAAQVDRGSLTESRLVYESLGMREGEFDGFVGRGGGHTRRDDMIG